MTDNTKLYSINVEHRFTQKGGEEKSKLVEVAVGFGNSKAGLSFALPAGLQITSEARVVIFPIERKGDGE